MSYAHDSLAAFDSYDEWENHLQAFEVGNEMKDVLFWNHTFERWHGSFIAFGDLGGWCENRGSQIVIDFAIVLGGDSIERWSR